MAFSGGSGTLADPYQIATVADLELVKDYLSSNFILMNNLDLSDTSQPDNSWAALGNSTAPFTGVFDGNGKTLANIKIKSALITKPGGLFSYATNATIKDLTITGAANFSAVAAGIQYMSPLVAVGDTCIITNCHVMGTITDAYRIVGGLVGLSRGCTLSRCSAILEVSTDNYTVGGLFIGGLVGNATLGTDIYQCKTNVTLDGQNSIGGISGSHSSGRIEQCYTTGSITCRGVKAGGLIGSLVPANVSEVSALIKDNYSQATVTDEVSGYQEYAGLIGYTQVSATYTTSVDIANCYSTGRITPQVGSSSYGGFMGYRPLTKTTVTSCFYDTNTSGQTDTGKGEPRTTGWMKSPANFIGAGWDFDTVWVIPTPGTDYPLLQWDNPVVVVPVEIEPMLTLRWRNDGKQIWTNSREISLGNVGCTDIVKRIKGLGKYRTRQYELVCTSGVPVTISMFEEE